MNKNQKFFAKLPEKVINDLNTVRIRAAQHARKPSNAEIVSRGIEAINRELDFVEKKEAIQTN